MVDVLLNGHSWLNAWPWVIRLNSLLRLQTNICHLRAREKRSAGSQKGWIAAFLLADNGNGTLEILTNMISLTQAVVLEVDRLEFWSWTQTTFGCCIL